MSQQLKKFFTGLIAVLMVVSVTSCKKATYYQLTDEEMTWLVYKNNELLRFTNQSGDVVQYYVTIRIKGYVKDGETYSEFTAADFQQLNDTTAIFQEDSKGTHYMFKGESGFSVTLTWPHFPFKEVSLHDKVPTFETIGGINYNDIFVLDASGFTDIRFYNKTLWVSRSFGVVQIEDTAGNLWVRNF